MHSRRLERGFTLVEIIIVLALVGAIFAALAPNFAIIPSTQQSIILGRLASDVRNAFDVAVLSGRTHRLVFHLHSGKYWLEIADSENFMIDTHKLRYDPTKADEQQADEDFEQLFARYTELAGEEVFDPQTEKPIKPESPVLQAKDKLRPTKWRRVDYQEWGVRDLKPSFIISEMLVEHHDEVQRLNNLPEEDGRVVLYFFPQGVVERAQIKLAFLSGGDQIDTSKDPYIVSTEPYTGTIDLTGTNEELELRDGA